MISPIALTSAMMMTMPKEQHVDLPDGLSALSAGVGSPLRLALLLQARSQGEITYATASEEHQIPHTTARRNIDALEDLGLLIGEPAKAQRKSRLATFRLNGERLECLVERLRTHLL